MTNDKQSISIEGSKIKCKLPYVVDYNTSIARFRDQILYQVLTDLQRNCYTVPDSPALLAETANEMFLSHSTNLTVLARSIDSVDVTPQNISFEIIGFSSAIVRISGEAAIKVDYTGVDNLKYNQQEVLPFSEDVTILGNFPTDSNAEGEVRIDNIQNTNIQASDPTAFITVETNLSMTAITRILAFVPLVAGWPVLLSSTFHRLFLPVVMELEAYAVFILSAKVSLRNVLFEIVGFASALVRISGEVVLDVIHWGVDAHIHSQQVVAPFSNVVTIPGNFPLNSYAEGTLIINNIVIVPEVDPSIIAITAVTANVFMTANVRIFAPG
jgi:hypothetical protein